MFYNIIALLALLVMAICISCVKNKTKQTNEAFKGHQGRVFVMYIVSNGNNGIMHLKDMPHGTTVSCQDESSKRYFIALASVFGVRDNFAIGNKDNATLYCQRVNLDKFNRFFKNMNSDQSMTLCNYEGVDEAELNFFLPHVQFRFVDFRLYMPKVYELTHIFKCIYDEDVHELFEATSIAINHPIEITPIVNKYDEFKVIETNHRIPLSKQGDVITLSNQKDRSFNGSWLLASPMILQSMPMVKFSDYFDEIPSNSRDRVKGVAKKGVNFEDMGSVWFSDLDVAGSIKDNIAVIHAKLSNESKYECVSNADYLTRETCESEYDVFGKKKLTHDVWDRRCRVNTDCPFYDAKKTRGTCNDNGYCELPLGVKRVGYTRYSGKPYCHDEACSDIAFAYDDRKQDGYTLAEIKEMFVPDDSPDFSQSPVFEYNDADFQEKYLQGIEGGSEGSGTGGNEGIENKQKIEIKKPPRFFLNDSCQELLKKAGLDTLGYTYRFGKSDRVMSDGEFYYFTAIVCIHAPSKSKGKVVQYDCIMQINGPSISFSNIATLGSIFESELI